MADSVGQIGLDLVVNQNQFHRQMAGIQGLAKKAGAALAAAFAVKKIWDFGAACVNLGSDLDEVQNVVDVAFPRMAKDIDAFAKNATTSFGLSETMAKQFTGTFGAMAEAFGFGEKQAYEMSTALTGLSGDVASFYNISQEEAFSKLKSVFTGETIALKELGIVMTQAALDQCALSNGFGKTTAKMSESEKVALRYAFVQDRLALASGDFIRTSGGWANQVRILKVQFDGLKATIGQGLINVLTPAVRVINLIISKLMSLANAFKAFTEMATGKKSGGGASAVAAGMGKVADAADAAGAAMGNAAGAAKKAKAGLSDIDKLHVLTTNDSDGGGGGGAGADGGYSPDVFDMGKADASAMNEIDGKYQGLIDKAKEFAGLFKKGFWDGFGDASVFDKIQTSIDNVKGSLKQIFTSPEVLGAANAFASRVAYSLGQITGSVGSIGASIADNLLGGISLFLQQNSERIKKYIVSMFDIGGHVAQITGNFSEAMGVVFSSLRSNSAKQITADVIGIFSEAFMGVAELSGTFGADILDAITGPFIDNADYIKSTMEDTFSAVEPMFSTIKELVSEMFEKMKTTYDEHVAPMLAAFKKGFTEIGTLLLNVYNTYFLPVLQNLSWRFGEFKNQYLDPLIDKFMEFGGKAADAVTRLWTGVIQPFIEWFIINVAPVIADSLQAGIDVFFTFWEAVSGVIGGILTALGGIIDFVTGIFTGDWSLAWKGIKEIFSGIWQALKAVVSGAIKVIGNVINQAWTSISGITSAVWNGIKTLLGGLWDWLKSLASTLFSAIKTAIGTAWDAVKNKTSEIWNGIKNALSTLWSAIKTAVGDKFTAMRDAITGAWDTVKTKTKKTWDGIWSGIKGVINMIIGGVENMANRVIDGINAMINAVNKVADKVPGVGKDLIPSIPRINLPHLAQGGFVRANTPQLAMIGDNRHQGEIVAPENKLKALLDEAVKSKDGSQELLEIILLLHDMTGFLKTISLKGDGRMTAAEVFQAVREENGKYVRQHRESAFI